MTSKLDPLYIIANSKPFQLCSLIAKGAVFEFVSTWFYANCPEIKVEDYNNVMRLSPCSWNRHSKRIIAALDDILPKLNSLHHRIAVTSLKRRKNMLENVWNRRDEWFKQAKIANSSKQAVICDGIGKHTEINTVGSSRPAWGADKTDTLIVAKTLENKGTKKPKQFMDK